MRSLRREIDKQAREYERRLSELNHAHDKQVADQATYVSGARYEGWQGEINSWRGQVSATLSELAGRTGMNTTFRGNMVQIVTIAIAVAALVMAFFRGGHLE